MNTRYFDALIYDLARCHKVEAILLAGSKAMQTDDAQSDYDVYVYTIGEIPVETRQAITEKYCSYMELNNQFWETEDDGILLDGTPIELIYRSLTWFDAELERVLLKYQANTGYTTCFWSNLLNSNILYDSEGRAKALQEKYSISYPLQLKKNIIRKNYPLLRQQMPAYYHQIKKALHRADFISVNHRMTEFLASYFDILFAINEYPHPGEKKLLAVAKTQCHKLPEQFEDNMTRLIQLIGKHDRNILQEIEKTVEHLDALLQQEGLFVGVVTGASYHILGN
jgi:hypothetical protein